MRKWILLAVVIAGVAAGAYYLILNRSTTSTAAEVPAMMAVPVTRQSLSKSIAASGRLEPVRDVNVAFGASGIVTEMHVAVGDRVTAGDVLGRLDQRDVQIDLIRAQREYEQARLDATESVKEEKRIAYELAKRKAEGTTLIAPFDGLVVDVLYGVGDSAQAQGPAVRMIDTSAYRIVVDIDQLDLRHIAVGQNVIVKVDSFPELLLRGNVTRIGWLPASSSGVVSYPVEVTVAAAFEPQAALLQQGLLPAAAIAAGPAGVVAGAPAGVVTGSPAGNFPGGSAGAPAGAPPGAIVSGPPGASSGDAPAGIPADAPTESPAGSRPGGQSDGGPARIVGLRQTMAQDLSRLRPGLTVQVEIVIEEAHDVLVVPLAAVVEDGPIAYVTRVTADGKEEVTPVQLGMTDSNWVEIRSGLNDGDRVLMNNYQLYTNLTANRQGGGSNRSGGGGGFVGTFGAPAGAVRIVR